MLVGVICSYAHSKGKIEGVMIRKSRKLFAWAIVGSLGILLYSLDNQDLANLGINPKHFDVFLAIAALVAFPIVVRLAGFRKKPAFATDHSKESPESTQECPFCRTEIKAHATVCPNCHAVKAIGVLGKVGPVGAEAVFKVRFVVIVGYIASAIMILTQKPGPFIGGVLIALLCTAIVIFNWRIVFFRGQYRWFRER